MADAGDNGGSVRARSRLVQAETGVQARARMRRATAGQRHWRLSRAGRELWQWQWRQRQRLGDLGLRWEGECEVTK